MKQLLLTLGIISLSLSTMATQHIVTNTNDAGTNSLRALIALASEGDTIRFSPSLIAGGSNTIVLTSEIAFQKGLVFKGLLNSTDTLFISGGNTNRIFLVDLNTASNKNIVLDSMSITDGFVNGNGGALAFDNVDSLKINHSMIKNSNATLNGGGIYLSSNTATTLILNHTTVSGNKASSAHGGGIYSHSFSSSSVNLINSTVSGNTVSSSSSSSVRGGGIFSSSSSSSSSVILTNSSVIGNTAFSSSNPAAGGGIFSSTSSFSSSSSSINLTNSTVSGNIASSASASARGGGIFSSSSSSSSVMIGSSIVALNGANNIHNSNSQTIISQGYNVFSESSVTGSASSDKLGVDSAQLNLGPLQDNGGATFTMLPGCGSIAYNMGDPTDFSDAQNQSVSDGRRDVGAAERNSSTTKIVQNTHNDGFGSLRHIIENACEGDTIRFNPNLIAGGSKTILLTSQLYTNKGLTIIGLYNSSDTLFVSGGGTNRILYANSPGKNFTLDSMVFINGKVNGNGGALAFDNVDSLKINHSVIKNSNSTSSGGGIYLSSNTATTLSLNHSTVSGNKASSAHGGGIYSHSFSSSSVNLINSTVSGNTVSSSSSSSVRGGGIFSSLSSSSSSSVILTNSSVIGNTAFSSSNPAAGGGIFSSTSSFSSSSSSINLTNSTVSGNIASSASASARGGGIFSSSSSSSSVMIGSSIVALNGANNIHNSNSQTIISQGYNVFSESSVTGSASSDKLGVDSAQLNLGPLQDNGGATFTMLPGCGSIAYNMGDPTDFSDAQNQSVSDGRRDVGAAERNSSTTKIVQNTHNDGFGSLRHIIENACEGDTIRFNPNLIAGGSKTILLTSQLYTNKGLTIIGLYNSSDTLFVSGGGTNRILYANSPGKNFTLDSMVFINGKVNGNGGALAFDNVDSLKI
ncbi:MAG: beta strand repeat-containing protein, partial [Flavobacteriales bacterium]